MTVAQWSVVLSFTPESTEFRSALLEYATGEPSGVGVLRVMSKKTVQRHGFRTGESIVYPSHGVGKIIDIEEQVVAGMKLELFVINFQKDKMTLRVPVAKASSVGMRKLADEITVGKAFSTVRGRARVKRTMWSRRAQEYEAKINSGDLIAISEVVRDLYRSQAQPEPSYSERQLYEQAIDRMSREVAVVEKITETEAVTKIEKAIEASPRRKRAAEAAEEEAQNKAA
jgi:CarD family transcriptional regulator